MDEHKSASARIGSGLTSWPCGKDVDTNSTTWRPIANESKNSWPCGEDISSSNKTNAPRSVQANDADWPCGKEAVSNASSKGYAKDTFVGQDFAQGKSLGTDVRLEVCSTCHGGEAVLKDLEDLAPLVGVHVTAAGCLGRCTSGPNCYIDVPEEQTARRKKKTSKTAAIQKLLQDTEAGEDPWASCCSDYTGNIVVTRINTFEKCLDLLRCALAGAELNIPDIMLRRARLRSDAMRRISSGLYDPSSALDADRLLSDAIALELQGDTPMLDAHCSHASSFSTSTALIPRLRELRMLRAEVRASSAVGRFEDAIADIDLVLSDEPSLLQAYLEKAKALRRAGRRSDALEAFRKLLIVDAAKEQALSGDCLGKHMRGWVHQRIEELEEWLVEQEAAAKDGCSNADAGNDSATDSGDGSGRWKVVKITGISMDSCIYHLTNHPPAEPHPFPQDLWHVTIRFGSNVREYTPVSSVAEWEQGKLDLLVKTYADGIVSRRFATLQCVNSYTPLEEQKCWLMVSAPRLTLNVSKLPPLRQLPPDDVAEVGLVVGGTGIAPALQLLRLLGDVDNGYGTNVRISLLYSSKTPADVLMLDELRELQTLSPQKVSVHHTLTRFDDIDDGSDRRNLEASAVARIPCRHWYFISKWRPFKPKEGPLKTGSGEEAALRGQVTVEMLKEILAPPSPSSCVVVCGPQAMLDDVQQMLASIGHQKNNVFELNAFSSQQLSCDTSRLDEQPSLD